MQRIDAVIASSLPRSKNHHRSRVPTRTAITTGTTKTKGASRRSFLRAAMDSQRTEGRKRSLHNPSCSKPHTQKMQGTLTTRQVSDHLTDLTINSALAEMHRPPVNVKLVKSKR